MSYVSVEHIAVCYPLFLSAHKSPLSPLFFFPLQGHEFKNGDPISSPRSEPWLVQSNQFGFISFGIGYFICCYVTKSWSMQPKKTSTGKHLWEIFFTIREMNRNVFSLLPWVTVMSAYDSGTVTAILSPWREVCCRREKPCLYFMSLWITDTKVWSYLKGYFFHSAKYLKGIIHWPWNSNSKDIKAKISQILLICLQCRRPSFNPWVGKMFWRRKWQSTPLSCLENPRDRGAWQATVLVSQSRTGLSDFHFLY